VIPGPSWEWTWGWQRRLQWRRLWPVLKWPWWPGDTMDW